MVLPIIKLTGFSLEGDKHLSVWVHAIFLARFDCVVRDVQRVEDTGRRFRKASYQTQSVSGDFVIRRLTSTGYRYRVFYQISGNPFEEFDTDTLGADYCGQLPFNDFETLEDVIAEDGILVLDLQNTQDAWAS